MTTTRGMRGAPVRRCAGDGARRPRPAPVRRCAARPGHRQPYGRGRLPGGPAPAAAFRPGPVPAGPSAQEAVR